MHWRLIRWTGFMIQMSTNSKVAQEGELKKKKKKTKTGRMMVRKKRMQNEQTEVVKL